MKTILTAQLCFAKRELQQLFSSTAGDSTCINPFIYVVSNIRLSFRSFHSVDQRHASAAFGQLALALSPLGSVVQQTIHIVTILLNGIFHTGNIKPGKEHSKKLTKKRNTFVQHKWKSNNLLLCDIWRVYCMYCPLQVPPQHLNWTEIWTLIGPFKISTDDHLA